MVNNKCNKCGKTVYAAEEKRFEHPKDGLMFFHGLCFGAYKKEYDQSLQDHRNREYGKKPDVAPAYYRVADPTTGETARMETSSRDQQ